MASMNKTPRFINLRDEILNNKQSTIHTHIHYTIDFTMNQQ